MHRQLGAAAGSGLGRPSSEGDLVACAVLSGNRNFEARIHPEVKANYLASPPLVVAYALAGRMDIDITTEPLGHDPDGEPVYLADIWPSPAEVQETIEAAIGRDMFLATYANVYEGEDAWRELPVPTGELFAWEDASTYVRRPPYFDGMAPRRRDDRRHHRRALPRLDRRLGHDRPHLPRRLDQARTRPPGDYLVGHGVERADFNSYGSRRGNHEVMVRGTFANVRLRNQLVPGSEGTWTAHLPDGEETTIFAAAERYLAEGVPTIVLAGKEYGSGSSRDWAAKGPNLLGVRAVIAESYERIHRSNLLMMGILPLQYLPGESLASLGLTGREEFSVTGVENGEAREVTVAADDVEFRATLRLDTPREREYVRHGGILPYVLRRLLSGRAARPSRPGVSENDNLLGHRPRPRAAAGARRLRPRAPLGQPRRLAARRRRGGDPRAGALAPIGVRRDRRRLPGREPDARVAGLIGAQARVPAMTLMRAPLGERGSYLPTAINIVQCLGWTVFELLVIATAAAALSDQLFGVGAQWAWTLVFGAAALAMGLARPDRRRAHGAPQGRDLGRARRDRLPDLVGAQRRRPLGGVGQPRRGWPLDLAGHRHRRRRDGLVGPARGRLHALRPDTARGASGARASATCSPTRCCSASAP